MKCIFLYNPNSGRGLLLDKLDYIKAKLEEKYDEVTMYPTSSREDLKETAYNACKNYDCILFSGGDGTFNDVCNSVSKSDVRPVLGYIPSGTCNDIAKNLKIPFNYKKALNVILKEYSIKHDVGMINDEYFMYVVGAGAFTECTYSTEQKLKKVLGKIAYIMDGIKRVSSLKNIDAKIIIDGKEYNKSGPLLLVLNSKSVAGVPFNKRGHLNDGVFDVIICRKFWTILGALAKLMVIGTFKGRDHTDYYDFYRGKEIKIELDDDFTWTVDGEKGPSGSVVVKNIPAHLEIFVPKARLRRRPKSKLLYSTKVLERKIKNRVREIKNENNSRKASK